MSFKPLWSRRSWLMTQSAALVAAPRLMPRILSQGHAMDASVPSLSMESSSSVRIDRPGWEALAQRAVEAVTSVGATYCDVRLTRKVTHQYEMHVAPNDQFYQDLEETGFGVRALVNGYWGFAADSKVDEEAAVRLAKMAVAQAKANAKGPSRVVEMGRYPVVRGTWTTPVKIDPFTISIEEKSDAIMSWCLHAQKLHLAFDPLAAILRFTRHERVVANSEGSLFTQTLFESGGNLKLVSLGLSGTSLSGWVQGVAPAGTGWEMLLDADIVGQLNRMPDEIAADVAVESRAKTATVGRYTMIFDGFTMASVLQETLGLATQLDRALGYEANARGTSYLDDPLSMVGNLRVAAPSVTVTANRSASKQLATVKWDDEGVVPRDVTLVQDGVLTDFQTTREQASWLAPYYTKLGRPVVSNGYAASETALRLPMQHMPNLALQPRGSAKLEDLIASVESGILVQRGDASTDFQAKNGMISGHLRQITKGRLGAVLNGGAILFKTSDLWKNFEAVGDASTCGTINDSQYPWGALGVMKDKKGQPVQGTSHSVTAAAAVIGNQAIINPSKKF